MMRAKGMFVVALMAVFAFVVLAEAFSEESGLPREVNVVKFNLDPTVVKAKRLTIGFSQCVMDHPYRVSMVEKAKEAGKRLGVTILATDGQGRAEKEVSNIQTFIARKVDAIVISSHGGVAISPAIKQANKAGIPVILIDGGRPYSDWDYVCWMSTDDWLLGENAGTFMAMQIGTKGKVAMLEGTPGSSCQQGRREGFLKALANYPDIKLVANQQANWLRLNALDLTSNILQANPDLNAIYAHNDEMAVGAIEAIKKAGKKPGKDVLVYSAADQQKNALEAIAAGELQLTQGYVDDGGYAVEAAIYHLLGGTLPKKMNLGTSFVTQYNFASYKPAY